MCFERTLPLGHGLALQIKIIAHDSSIIHMYIDFVKPHYVGPNLFKGHSLIHDVVFLNRMTSLRSRAYDCILMHT